ncbi:MAG: hypothetical protein OEM67_03330 [Thermoleophilia bacterium]|nr:hypothetical protein [Thermoleophilia bacterium]MDH3724798.1 hypothetical protein [Thermoleophilia bacterium]
MSERDAVVREWATAEEGLYPIVTTRPDLYEACTGLVRSLADHLRDVPDLHGLVATFRMTDLATDLEQAGIDPTGISPEIRTDLVRGAAYAMRSRELIGEDQTRAARAAIARARRTTESTVTIWGKGDNELHPPYRRVEMALDTGRAVAISTEISPDTMRAIFIVAGIQLDPETGEAIDDDLLAAERTFTDAKEWHAAADELRSLLLEPE